MSDICKNNAPTARKLAICVFKIEAKANLFWDKSTGRRHAFFGIGATQPTAIFDGKTSSRTWRPVRLKMDASFLGFTHRRPKKRSVASVSWTTSRREICDGAWIDGHHTWRRVFPKMEIELLGFANRRPKKRFATSVSRKYGEKTSRSEGRLELMVWRLWLLLLCLYSSLLNSGEGDRGGKDVSCIRIKTGGNGRNLNCRGSYPELDSHTYWKSWT